jgi:hypothetical protein
VVSGFWHSHIGWLLEPPAPADRAGVSDLERFPELRVLDRYHHMAPVTVAVGTYVLGAAAIRYQGCQPQQLASRPADAGRWMAQQSPPVPKEFRATV